MTILVDRDGYEICFVEDEAFYDLATPTYDIIDFDSRAARGGDGAPPPKHKLGSESKGEPLPFLETVEEYEEQVTSVGEKLLVLDFGAGWCKNCKKVKGR